MKWLLQIVCGIAGVALGYIIGHAQVTEQFGIMAWSMVTVVCLLCVLYVGYKNAPK